MSSYQAQGTLIKTFPTEQVSDKFQKRSLWLRTEGQYAQTIEFQLTQTRCDLLDQYAEGMEVIVHFDLQGRIWSDPQKGERVFNTLNCWKLERVGAAHTAQPMPSAPMPQPTYQQSTMPEPQSDLGLTNTDGGNDLPF